MVADHRITAGIDMDGDLTYIDGSLMPVARHGLDRPFLLLGKDGDTDTDPGWKSFRAHSSPCAAPPMARSPTRRPSRHSCICGGASGPTTSAPSTRPPRYAPTRHMSPPTSITGCDMVFVK